MALDLNDPTTRDYLGNPAGVSVGDKPSLPVSGLPAAAGPGGATPGATLSARTPSNQVTSSPLGGEPAKPGTPVPEVLQGKGQESGSGRGDLETALQAVMAGGRVGGSLASNINQILSGQGLSVAEQLAGATEGQAADALTGGTVPIDEAAGGSVPYGAIVGALASVAGGAAQGKPWGDVLAGGVRSLSEGLASTYGGPLWNLFFAPKAIGELYEMFDPSPENNPESIKRKMGRTSDAQGLAGEILGPLSKAKTPEEFVSALGTDVGGARIGDALAQMIFLNKFGGWLTDTAHGWAPDPALAPLEKFLTSQGYTGSIGGREPKRGDVGGVGEIVTGSGQFLVPEAMRNYFGEQSSITEGESPRSLADRGIRPPEEFAQWGVTPRTDMANPMGDPNVGALGWEHALRELSAALSGEKITRPSSVVFSQLGPYGGIYPGTPTAEQMEGVDPLVAQRIAGTTGTVADSLRVMQETAGSAP